MDQKYNLHCVEAGLNQVLDARPHARRRRIRRGFVYSRLLLVRRSDCRSRLSDDGVSRSIGETIDRPKQNDQLPSGARLFSEQDFVGRGLCPWASANSGNVHARSRQGARLHKAGYLENSNGFPRHYRPAPFDITQERGSTQHLPQNQYQQIWTQTK